MWMFGWNREEFDEREKEKEREKEGKNFHQQEVCLNWKIANGAFL